MHLKLKLTNQSRRLAQNVGFKRTKSASSARAKTLHHLLKSNLNLKLKDVCNGCCSSNTHLGGVVKVFRRKEVPLKLRHVCTADRTLGECTRVCTDVVIVRQLCSLLFRFMRRDKRLCKLGIGIFGSCENCARVGHILLDCEHTNTEG